MRLVAGGARKIAADSAKSEEMEERVESGEDVEDVGHRVAPIPPPMQLLSTWEVKRVPHNCVTRLCMVTVTRLEVKQSLELNLSSVVVAVAMKTPHRFLRSNEIALPPSGTLDIPLQLTFSLQVVKYLLFSLIKPHLCLL